MELLTIKITPLTNFATIPKGDTIFGQILSYLFLQGDDSFKNYLNEEPKLIVSDMMPYGYVYKPALPLNCFKETVSKEVDKKELRKKKFITVSHIQNGDLHKCEKVDFIIESAVVKNSINRTTFTTEGDDFAPYGNIEITFTKKLWMFILVESDIKNKILKIIENIGKFGFGKDANTGKGCFEIEQIKTPIENFKSNYYMSISPAIIQNQNFDNIWYEPFTRFGKYGLSQAHTNAFKKPVLMADSGCVIQSNLHKAYIGKAINNGTENKPSFLQGYSIAIPIKIKDEKCLDTK